MTDLPEQIMDYCTYCKNEVLPTDRYIVKNGYLYHKACDEQRRTFYDSTDGRYEGDRQYIPGREYGDSE